MKRLVSCSVTAAAALALTGLAGSVAAASPSTSPSAPRPAGAGAALKIPSLQELRAAGRVVKPTKVSKNRVGVQGYDCAYGASCIWEGWDGSGWKIQLPGCGMWLLDGVWNMASSAQTHGNGLGLYTYYQRDDVFYPIGFVPSWTATNFGPESNDRTALVDVYC